MEEKTKTIKRRLTGEVVSDKMQKTIVVRVDRTVVHSLYGKRYTVSKRYKVDAPDGSVDIGDIVTIEACRPISKEKRWRLVNSKNE